MNTCKMNSGDINTLFLVSLELEVNGLKGIGENFKIYVFEASFAMVNYSMKKRQFPNQVECL